MGHSESFEYLYVKIGPWVWPDRVPEKKVTQGAYFAKIHQAMGAPTMVAPWDLITLANFKFGRLRTGCVVLHESLLSFRFSALHRLSPLTQLGPAGPLVINFDDRCFKLVEKIPLDGETRL